MSSEDRQAEHADERNRIRQAAERLRAGKPQHSNGKHAVSTLAAEARISRQRLYEHHADLVTEFKTAAGGGFAAPNIRALQRQLDDAHERIRQLDSHTHALQERIRTLTIVIVELTHEAQAANVLALPRKRGGARPS